MAIYEGLGSDNNFFMRYEDKFNTSNSNSSLGALGSSNNNNNAPQEIIITCENKKSRICGFLSEGVHLNGKSEWKEMFGGGIMSIANSAISTVDRGLQLFNGTSIQQPWMNRKYWVSSKPFSFEFSFNFISDGNTGKNDVFLPAQTLMSFVYPRDLGTDAAIKNSIQRSPFWSKIISSNDSTVINTAISAFCRGFAIPGPDIAYGASDNNGEAHKSKGDAVTIVIGNMFAFGGVYLEDVDVKFSPTMDCTGYPTWAKCSVKATVMDVNYCTQSGDFVISQFTNGATAISNFAQSVKNFGGAVIGAIGDNLSSTVAAIMY